MCHLSLRSNCPARLPVTPDVLAHFGQSGLPLWSLTNCMLWAASCLGFAAFLCLGELTCPSVGAYDSSMLSWSDMLVDSHTSPTLLVVGLCHSKTDFFGTGVSLCVGDTGSPNCPVAAVLAYMPICPPRPEPIF